MLDFHIMSPEVITASLVCGVAGFLYTIYTRIDPQLKKYKTRWYHLCPGFSLFACSLFVLYSGAADWRLRFEEVLVSVGIV